MAPRRSSLLVLALLAVAPQNVGAAEADAETKAVETRALPADRSVVTRHRISIAGQAIDYSATAAVLALPAQGSTPEARLFHVSYRLDGAEAATRPLTFVFNGGPGAAAAYLHLGALGPRLLTLNGDGTVPPPPARFEDNPLTWLAFTDLVFVDPVGTGYSRSLAKDAKKDDEGRAFFATRADIDSLARFIRLYLTRHERWLSPKILVGESYGGFRVAMLAARLQSSFGIGVNGAILVSPVLDFSLIQGGDAGLLPWAMRLPSFAAAALHHRARAADPRSAPVTREALSEVESWALGGYIAALAEGDALSGEAAEAFVDRLAATTGLAPDLVRRRHGRIPIGEFANALLRGSGRVLNLYDASVTALDSDPESASGGSDRSLAILNAALVPAINAYLRSELDFETDLPYLVLNRDVSRHWRWRGDGGGQGYAGALDELRDAMTFNPRLQVLIAHGLFDLVTPYFASAYGIRQMHLHESVRGNVTLRTYAAGHMLYTQDRAREAFHRDAEALYRRSVPATPAPRR